MFLSAAIRVYRKMGDVAMVQSLESIEVNPYRCWGIQLRHYFGKQTEEFKRHLCSCGKKQTERADIRQERSRIILSSLVIFYH